MADVSLSVSAANESPRHVLRFGQKVAYSVGHILNDLCASMWFTYFLIFQHSVLQFSNITAGNLLLLGQVVDAISTPFVGYESDKPNNLWLCKYGRRKAWHLVGTICVVGSFSFLFMDCIGCSESSQNAQFVYYGAFIAIFQFGWAAVQVSHLSLIPDLTPVSSERVELNSIRYAMTVMSNICVHTSMYAVLGLTSSDESHVGPHDLHVFRNVSLSMVALGTLFSVIFHVYVKEKEHGDIADQEQRLLLRAEEIVEKPHLTWKDWFFQPQFYMIGLLYMGTRLYINLSSIYMPLYIQDTLGLHKDKIAIIPLVIFVSGFLSSFFVNFLNRFLGHKATYFFGCSLAIAGCVWIYFGGDSTYNTYEIYAVATIIGVAGSTLLIISLSITADMIANSTTSCAFVFGSMSFVDKLSNGIAVEIIQNLHPCRNCCKDCGNYYKYVLVYACGGAIVFSLIALSCLLTQSIGERRNEEQLHRNSIIRHNRRYGDSASVNHCPEEFRNNAESEALMS